ncbi:PREDICTED: ATP synthase subunit O, mitochondrial [Cercocebus atys]|uniref:ATP synthase subunit O, mitochondrial n=1 Tax=Cercocebus atys TaxID=9531 RepID=UPI0005F390BA|nr:PREDICTED: ATP synthase subunit O, mitochondrial [Cercocebus atys]
MAAPAVSGLSRQVRCFSTSVVRPFAKLVRPPVQVYGIEGRYATALYSAASKQNKLEQVEKELLRVAQILKEPKVAASVLNPYVKRSIKVKSLNDITAKERFSPLTTNLISEYPLEGATLSELKTVLKSFLSQGQVLKLEAKTDPSIMGGMIVRIGEKYVDMSVKTKIQKLGRAMRETL